jgi:hypothetical protein
VAADQLVVGAARLGVLTDHVHVLKGTLQEMSLVHRCRTGGMVDRVDYLNPSRIACVVAMRSAAR